MSCAATILRVLRGFFVFFVLPGITNSKHHKHKRTRRFVPSFCSGNSLFTLHFSLFTLLAEYSDNITSIPDFAETLALQSQGQFEPVVLASKYDKAGFLLQLPDYRV